MTDKNHIKEFFKLLERSTSPFHAVHYSIEVLQDAGFQELSFEEPWQLQKGASYYVNLYDTTLFAFTIGKDLSDDAMLRMGVAHTDIPCFRVKPNPEMRERGYLRLNTDVYGGVILSTWFDRPLSIAGKVALKADKAFASKHVFVDFQRPLLVIPNLPIHLNREVNKGVEINRQKDVLPILGMIDDSLDMNFHSILAKELGVDSDDILDYDLYIYNLDKPVTVGLQEDFICAPRIDDLSSVYALLEGIINGVHGNDIHMVALFDNEEVGNFTKQGAASRFTTMLLEKIFASLGLDRINLYETLTRSFIVSVDVAHGYHPNFSAKYDPTNVTELNKGIVLKIDAAQRYAFDVAATGIVQQLCMDHNIPFQKFTNRSDATAGSTMGPEISTQLPAKTMDIGLPLLAMHSSRETVGSKDLVSLVEFMKVFFSVER